MRPVQSKSAPTTLVSVLYEYPLNERVRALLRIEDLLDRMAHHLGGEHAWDHHATLMTLFEILEVCSRGDLKSDVLQELERNKQSLLAFRGSTAVDGEKLEAMLAQLDLAYGELVATSGKTGAHVRENEWLSAVRSRAIIPGGTCEFDLPSYHAWLQSPLSARRADLAAWIAPLKPLGDGMHALLRLLREAGTARETVATGGVFSQDIKAKTYQLMRVRIDPALGVVPEISANKYMLHIRFVEAGTVARPNARLADVPFTLALCNL
jgi:cell division protein ZapD